MRVLRCIDEIVILLLILPRWILVDFLTRLAHVTNTRNRLYQTVPEPQSQLEPGSKSPPIYCMSRAVNSVRALWREWTEGLGGNPSVAALDSKWGSR